MKKESQKLPKHTSEHVKAQNFLGACPQTPFPHSILWALHFVFALGPSHPLGGPARMRQVFMTVGVPTLNASEKLNNNEHASILSKLHALKFSKIAACYPREESHNYGKLFMFQNFWLHQ